MNKAWSKTWLVGNREPSNDDDGSENVAKNIKFASFQMLCLFGAAKLEEFVKCRRFLLELYS